MITNFEKAKTHLSRVLLTAGVKVYHVGIDPEDDQILTVVLLSTGPEPLDLDRVTALTPVVSEALDQIDSNDDNYFLDLYSPLTYLPLFTLEHFRAVVGKKVTITLKSEGEGPPEVIAGILKDVNDERIILNLKKGEVELPWQAMIKGEVK